MSDLNPFLSGGASALGAAAVLAVLTWLASLKQHDVSLVDRVWSLMITVAALGFASAVPAPDTRAWVMFILTGLWAVRLAAYITWRNWGHGEDRRYQEIRARNQPGFAFKSLYLVFALQAVLACIVATPLMAALAADPRPAWTALDTVGALLAVVGLVFETVGDAQMARFKARPENQGRVMDQGLWRYTRHPNYFGETCVWWGLYLMALSAGGWWSIVSPVLMTVLLLKVSGVSLLEKDIGERRPAYRDYIRRTNAFFPGLPKRSSPE